MVEQANVEISGKEITLFRISNEPAIAEIFMENDQELIRRLFEQLLCFIPEMEKKHYISFSCSIEKGQNVLIIGVPGKLSNEEKNKIAFQALYNCDNECTSWEEINITEDDTTNDEAETEECDEDEDEDEDEEENALANTLDNNGSVSLKAWKTWADCWYKLPLFTDIYTLPIKEGRVVCKGKNFYLVTPETYAYEFLEKASPQGEVETIGDLEELRKLSLM